MDPILVAHMFCLKILDHPISSERAYRTQHGWIRHLTSGFAVHSQLMNIIGRMALCCFLLKNDICLKTDHTISFQKLRYGRFMSYDYVVQSTYGSPVSLRDLSFLSDQNRYYLNKEGLSFLRQMSFLSQKKHSAVLPL